MDNLPTWALWIITVAVGVTPGIALLEEAKGYWRLSPERRAAVIEARRENPAGTQEEIARAAGVSRTTVSRIERGDRRGGAVPL
jgi:predicted transcriptional regulator